MKSAPLPANLSTIIDAACHNETPLSAEAESWIRMAVYSLIAGNRVPPYTLNEVHPSTVEKRNAKAMKVLLAVQGRLAQTETVRKAADAVRTVADAFAGLGEGFFLGGLPCNHLGQEVKRHRVFVKLPPVEFEEPDATELARVQEEHAKICALLADTDFTMAAGPVLALRAVLVAMEGHFQTSQVQMEIVDALTARVHELEELVLNHAAHHESDVAEVAHWKAKTEAAEVALAQVKGVAQAGGWDEKQELHMWVAANLHARKGAEQMAATKGEQQGQLHALLCSYGWDGGQCVALKDWLETALGRAKANQATIDELLAAIPRVNERGSRDLVTWLKSRFEDMGVIADRMKNIADKARQDGWGDHPALDVWVVEKLGWLVDHRRMIEQLSDICTAAGMTGRLVDFVRDAVNPDHKANRETLAEITEWAVGQGWGSVKSQRLIDWLKRTHANYGEVVALADKAGRSASQHSVPAWLENIAMSLAGVVPESCRGATFTDGGLWPLGWGSGKPGELTRWSYGDNGPVPEAYTAKMKALEE